MGQDEMRHTGSEDEPSTIHPHFFLYTQGGERKMTPKSGDWHDRIGSLKFPKQII
jgi:hypothetical protein